MLMLLQSLQRVLELCLKVLHFTWDYSLVRVTLAPTFNLHLLIVNDLIRRKWGEKNKQQASGNTELLTSIYLSDHFLKESSAVL